jgi:hypothetical protein
MAVPAKNTAVSRHVHISAPHPIYDPGTPQQAAANFANTGAKSLFVAGRHRDAYLASSCVSAEYGKTDPAHDTVRDSSCLFLVVEPQSFIRMNHSFPPIRRCSHGKLQMRAAQQHPAPSSRYTGKVAARTILHSCPPVLVLLTLKFILSMY